MLATCTRAGAALYLLGFAFVLLLVVNPAWAGPEEPDRSMLRVYLTSGGASTFLVGAAIVILTALGAVRTGRSSPWPHWAGLVRGLGEAAFLLALMRAFSGMAEALATISAMGAAVTPSDVADGLGRTLGELGAGATVALAGLVGAGVIRFAQPRAA